MLALIKSADSDDVTKYFHEYFKFRRHVILGQGKNTLQELLEQLADNLDGSLLNCLHGDIIAHRDDVGQPSHYDVWPSHCCLCRPCVTLDGNRNRPPKQYTTVPSIRRLFIGDALWLCYFERMGIFQILGAILDAFASNGRLPISNGSLDPGVKDDIIALVLEIMVRQTKMGMSSDVRGRASMYRTSLGWVSEPGRKLGLDTEVNTGFNTLFHKFLFHALEYYRDRRLALAIQAAAATGGRPSAATLVTISETLDLLKKRFEAFDYGRNYYNALSGIVWVVAGMSVIRGGCLKSQGATGRVEAVERSVM
jgi:hypothetical protein